MPPRTRPPTQKKTSPLVWAAILCATLLGGLAIWQIVSHRPAVPATKRQDEPVVESQPAKAAEPMSSIDLVKTTIAAHKVVIWSKSYCPYCAKAKRALSQFLKDFYVVELDQRPDGGDLQEALGQLTGGRSVPRVFINGNFIGGGDDTAAKAANGELQQLLIQAGAISA